MQKLQQNTIFMNENTLTEIDSSLYSPPEFKKDNKYNKNNFKILLVTLNHWKKFIRLKK